MGIGAIGFLGKGGRKEIGDWRPEIGRRR